MSDDDRETSPGTPAAIRRSSSPPPKRETWPPRGVDERIQELLDAGATFTQAAEAVYFRHIRDATQEGLDACAALAADLRNEMDALRIDQRRGNEKVFELAQINSLLRDEVAEQRTQMAVLRAEIAALKAGVP